jgi:hypothetical protein
MIDPVINFEHSATNRYVTVMFRFSETSTEYVAARFNDPENPGETSEAERERLIAKARTLLQQVGSEQNRSQGAA